MRLWTPPLELPGQCAVCGSWGRGRVCGDCLARFLTPRHRCRRCALPVATGVDECGACVRAAPVFERTVAACDYAYPWDRLIARFKFARATDLATPLARLLQTALDRERAPPAHWIAPVPLAPARLAERGFNQAWEVARRLCTPGRATAAALLRVRDTPHQATLPRAQRESNLRHAFMVDPAWQARLQGADVALVDDVMTTGATLRECAQALRNAGARSVQAWVVARTPASDD
jgi:ComF family protein